MTCSEKITALLTQLQPHPEVHLRIRELFVRFTNAAFICARSGATITEKWRMVEHERRELLSCLESVTLERGLSIPYPAAEATEDDPHASY